ncbi:hypothetical protein GUITHDRAFT_152745 [Guillardia theta CCMP2712]|uniref:Uncharacterized protein n=1 Tax=Guillardia theta (strain CCMP2712) TaxID=905079 RepID=L1JAL5_GUITC|nr:hypothetical protein GUITHDRAFT_152745 [Guillardia theta CCMP2712]EKX45144.1 hypothetical protein GUITHDRAFT_152745 [Guillardia theta CCMP2712]|eukprot:XP_005832124.1 hypothetical protein GUITHDRAFT_152745 [Guillardia theta CCMP2712]
MNGHTETVRKLVSLGANVNERQKDGWTALHFAARNGWEETVEALVKLGIDPNVKNDVDMTALHYAAWDSTIETCQKLIDLGVDVNHKAKGKLSALELARKRRRELAGNKIAELLEKYSDVEKPSMEDESSPKTWEEWAPADPEWRKLIANDPYAQSITGREI